LAELEAAGLVTLADKGYQGAAHAKIPYRAKHKPQSQEEANRAHARLRARRARERPAQDLAHSPEAPLLPWRASQLAEAIHVLQTREA
jgi:hypothetical protein